MDVTTHMSDDVIEYRIYCLSSSDLNDVKEECLSFVKSETKGMIWNDQSFNLSLIKEGNVEFLYGQTRFGDSSDDEWLIVYLLKEISIKLNSLVIEVKDSDGQFLLIEAAEHIPKWLNPNTSPNRVFILNGSIIIIPCSKAENVSASYKINLEEALNFLKCNPEKALIIDSLQRCISHKIKSFPQKIFDNIFLANVYLPESAIHFLDKYPEIISQVVQTACSLDLIDMSLKRKTKFSLPGQLCWTQIKMTRHHYASLFHKVMQKFKTFNLNDEELGLHISEMIQLGFEVLCSRQIKDSGNISNKKFKGYLESLKTKGYFQNEMEGSKKYQQLYEKAKVSFQDLQDKVDHLDKQINHKMLEFFNKWPESSSNISLLIKKERSKLPSQSSDKFLEISDSDLDEMLKDMNEGFRKLNRNKEKRLDENFPDFAQQINGFVKSTSDYEGVEVSNNTEAINLDPDLFMSSLKKYMDGIESDCSDDFLSDETEDEEDDDEMREYYKAMKKELESTKVVTDVPNNPTDVDINLVSNFLKSCEDETDSNPASIMLANLDNK